MNRISQAINDLKEIQESLGAGLNAQEIFNLIMDDPQALYFGLTFAQISRLQDVITEAQHSGKIGIWLREKKEE